MSTLHHIYVVKAETGLVKIGYTATPDKRLKEIRRSIGSKIVDQHISPPCVNARQLERAVHQQFAEHRREGEWFAVDFETVVTFLEQQALVNGQPNQIVPFVFQSHTLRTFADEKGKLWFCLKDTCDILEIENSRDVLKRLKKAGVDTIYVSYPSGKKQLTFVDEPNFYRVIFRVPC